MQLNLKLSHKGLILVAVPLLFELAFIGELTEKLREAEKDIQTEAHSRAVVGESNGLMQHIIDCGAALYAYRKSKAPVFRQRYEDLARDIPEEIRALKRDLIDYPNQHESIQRVEQTATESLSLLAASQRITEKETSFKTLAEGKSVLRELESSLQKLVVMLRTFRDEVEAASASDPKKSERSRTQVVQLIYLGVAVNVAMAVALALYFNRSTARRLSVLMQNTNRLAEGKELNPALPGVDEIARLDQVFHDMADALAQAAAHKQELIAMVSHDLRTPLTSIQGSLTLLSAGAFGDLSDRAHKEVSVAEDNTTRLINLINDLLDIERMEAGKLEMHISETEVESIFDQTVDAIGMFAEQNGIAIHVEPTLCVVPADGDRIIQVLVNLISNAVKFSPKGSRITLSAAAVDRYVEIRVTDQGRGIPPEMVDSIFEKFSQVKKSDAKQRKGTGLGLAICKAIIEGHNGQIGVKSKVGEGSTFWFRLPLQHQPPA